MADKNTLKSYFEDGDVPTGAQFAELIDSLGLSGTDLVVITNSSRWFEMLPLSGGTMSGDINLGGNNISNINVLCATEFYVNTAHVEYQDIIISELSGFRMGGDLLVNGQISATGSIISDTAIISPCAILTNIDVIGDISFDNSTIVTDVTGLSEFMTITVNGSARAIQLFRY